MARYTLALMLLGGLFWQGLYAPGQQLVVTAGFALLTLAVLRRTAWSRLELVGAAMMVAGAGISLRSPAVAASGAYGPAVVVGWLLAMLAGRLLTTAPVHRILSLAWAVGGILMVFAPLVAMSYLPAHHSGRLASFLGYPIAVGLLGILGLAGVLPELAAGRWWASLLAFGNGVALLLSGSRGVWAAALLLLIYLMWAVPGLLRRSAGQWAPALSAALAAALWAGPAVAQRNQMGALVPVLLGSLTVLLWERFQPGPQGVPMRWAARLAWPVRAALTVAGAAALALAPGWPWLMGRATALTLSEGSWAERFIFMKDGLAMVRDFPLGAGYRAWTALHLQRASYAYYSAEVHSSLLDLTIAFGWLGGMGFALLLGGYLWRLRRGRTLPASQLPVLAALGALGLHSLVDWDLSYGAFAGALWFGFGLMRPGLGSKPGADPGADPGAWVLPRPAAAAMAGLALAASVVLGAGAVFTDLAQQALAAGRPEAAYRHALMATAVMPANDTAQGLAGEALRRLHRPDDALPYLARARQLGPYEPWYAELQAMALTDLGRHREALVAWQEYVRLWPWQTAAYEEALSAHLDLLLRAHLTGDDALARTAGESGSAILAAMDRQKAMEPPHSPRRPMAVDTQTIRQARDRFDAKAVSP